MNATRLLRLMLSYKYALNNLVVKVYSIRRHLRDANFHIKFGAHPCAIQTSSNARIPNTKPGMAHFKELHQSWVPTDSLCCWKAQFKPTLWLSFFDLTPPSFHLKYDPCQFCGIPLKLYDVLCGPPPNDASSKLLIKNVLDSFIS